MKEIEIAVIGLGYVGLPLARLFSTKFRTVGFDMNKDRVESLMSGHDATLEVEDSLLQEAIQKNGFKCTTDLEDIRDCNFYVVAVPTPVDENNRPDLKPLWGASETVGKVISKGDIVVYESTVYPGVTEEECLPMVERVSGLKFNVDFYAGYSPERINPGDKQHTVEKIKKVTSGSTPEIADIVDGVYNSVLINGTHKAPSIKVAEASKIIENSQRDVNIAFMNELAKISYLPDCRSASRTNIKFQNPFVPLTLYSLLQIPKLCLLVHIIYLFYHNVKNRVSIFHYCIFYTFNCCKSFDLTWLPRIFRSFSFARHFY